MRAAEFLCEDSCVSLAPRFLEVAISERLGLRRMLRQVA